MTRMYGISNCDKVKKARTWMDQHSISYEFHDFRKDGLENEQLSRWYNCSGEALINRRSTTWRNLSNEQRELATRAETIALLSEHPTLIQRPVLEHKGELLINYSDDSYSDFFNKDLT